MRTMINENGTKINVIEHIMLKNMWEYYVTDDKHNDDIVRCLVMGFETELGDVSLSEINPYVLIRTKNLNEVMPASDWRWEK